MDFLQFGRVLNAVNLLRRAKVSSAVCRTVRAGQHHGITVGIAYPIFPVIWATITCGWIAMTGQDNFNFHFLGARHGGIEIVYLKPQQDSIAVRFGVCITDAAMVMGHIPFMQLQYQPASSDQALVLRAAMRALAAKQPLIPAAACLNILRTDKWLWTHKNFRVMTEFKV
jgi:hypothetical protein